MFTEFETYMKQLEQDKSENTVNSYQRAIGKFLDACGVSDISGFKSLTPAQVRNYRDALLQGGNAVTSVNTYMRPLVAFANWLIENGYMEENVFSKVKALKEDTKMPDYLTIDEQKKLLEATEKGSQERLMLLYLLYTGVRRDELVHIKTGDIKEGNLKIMGKGRKERIIPLPEFLVVETDAYLRKRNRMNKSEFLFTSKRRGETLTGEAVRVRIKMICQKAGVREISPHLLRHSMATNLISAGNTLQVVSVLLGHANSLVTERRYAGVTNAVKTSAIASLPKLL